VHNQCHSGKLKCSWCWIASSYVTLRQLLYHHLLARAYIMSSDSIFICHNTRLCNASKYQNYIS